MKNKIIEYVSYIGNSISIMFKYAFYAIPVVTVGFHKDIEFTDKDNPWK